MWLIQWVFILQTKVLGQRERMMWRGGMSRWGRWGEAVVGVKEGEGEEGGGGGGSEAGPGTWDWTQGV